MHDFWVSEEFDAALTYLSAVSEKLAACERHRVEAPLSELLRLRKDGREPQRRTGADRPARPLQ